MRIFTPKRHLYIAIYEPIYVNPAGVPPEPGSYDREQYVCHHPYLVRPYDLLLLESCLFITCLIPNYGGYFILSLELQLYLQCYKITHIWEY